MSTEPEPTVSLPPPPEPEVPSIAVRPGKWWLPLVLAIVVGSILFQLRSVLTPFLLAFFVAYALDPAVDMLERFKVPRPLGALLIYLASGTLLFFVVTYGFSYIGDEVSEASQKLPGQIESLQKKADPWLQKTFKYKLPQDWKELYLRYGGELRQHSSELLEFGAKTLFGTLTIVMVVASLFIIPVFAFYLLIDFDRIKERMASLVPRRYRKTVGDTFSEIDRMIGGYVRGQLMAMLLLSVLYATGLKILGLRMAVPIGILTGTLSFIPYIGSLTGTLIAILMSVLDWHSGAFVLQVAAVMLTVQIIDGLFITPRIVGSYVGLGVVEVLLSMTACGTLFGFFGVLLAVPIGATVKILLRRATIAYKASHYYRRL